MGKSFRDMNQVNVVGRLVRDCSVQQTAAGKKMGKLSLAVNRLKRNNGDWDGEASFFDVVVFGRTVDNIGSYLTKGTRVAVSGELKQDRWEFQGKKHSKVVIQAQDVQLLGAPQQQRETGNQPVHAVSDPLPNRPRTHAEFTGVQPAVKESSLYDEFGGEDFDTEIPF